MLNKLPAELLASLPKWLPLEDAVRLYRTCRLFRELMLLEIVNREMEVCKESFEWIASATDIPTKSKTSPPQPSSSSSSLWPLKSPLLQQILMQCHLIISPFAYQVVQENLKRCFDLGLIDLIDTTADHVGRARWVSSRILSRMWQPFTLNDEDMLWIAENHYAQSALPISTTSAVVLQAFTTHKKKNNFRYFSTHPTLRRLAESAVSISYLSPSLSNDAVVKAAREGGLVGMSLVVLDAFIACPSAQCIRWPKELSSEDRKIIRKCTWGRGVFHRDVYGYELEQTDRYDTFFNDLDDDDDAGDDEAVEPLNRPVLYSAKEMWPPF